MNWSEDDEGAAGTKRRIQAEVRSKPRLVGSGGSKGIRGRHKQRFEGKRRFVLIAVAFPFRGPHTEKVSALANTTFYAVFTSPT
jgi:hypothetical protein